MEKNKILKMWSFVVVGERKEQNIKHEIWDYYYGCFSSVELKRLCSSDRFQHVPSSAAILNPN